MEGLRSAVRLRQFAHVLLAGLQRINFDLDAPVLGLVQRVVRDPRDGSMPMPAAENWFGCKRREFFTIASFTALARFVESSCDGALGHVALHGGIRVAFDDDACRAELARQLSDFLDHKVDVRIVELLLALPFDCLRDFLVSDPTSSGRSESRWSW